MHGQCFNVRQEIYDVMMMSSVNMQSIESHFVTFHNSNNYITCCCCVSPFDSSSSSRNFSQAESLVSLSWSVSSTW